ncbi:hypothetical protein [Candidatus Berkiella aquae]|uniref:Uncharacterized protein n=1 Tax=Candidatus Berkiella aquae TaxID=295108 RepID=A0A0Q9YCA1_9GAMM|nr:hypothetical protein [Candidatus Berkiella aquae]MCS5711041.1 hypothetical protein [Candidatus Berkiella aquae]
MLGGNSTENTEVKAETQDAVTEIIQDSPFYGLPNEIQLYILEQLISDPDFFKHLTNFAHVAKWPNILTKDFNLWTKIAQYWFNPENPRRKDKYNFFSNALAGIVSVNNASTLELALTNLAEFDYPHYIGSALEGACKAGNASLATLLLTNLLTKKQHTRDLLIQNACKVALANKHWPIVALLAQTDDCRKNAELMREISTQAAANNQGELVEQMLKQDLEKLRLTDKLAMVREPGFAATGLDLTDLFANNHWIIRTPLCFALRQLGYQTTPSVISEEVTAEVDVDVVADLLSDLNLEEETPTFIVSNLAQVAENERADTLSIDEPPVKSTLTQRL